MKINFGFMGKLALAAGLVLGLSAGLKALIEYDRTSGWKGGALTIGAAVALGLLAGSFKASRGFALPIMGMGAAMATMEVVGPTIEDGANKAVSWIKGGDGVPANRPKPKAPPADQDGDFMADYGDVAYKAEPVAKPAATQPAAGGNTYVTYQAPEAEKQEWWQGLLQEGVKGGFDLLKGYVSGSKGVNRAGLRRALAGV